MSPEEKQQFEELHALVRDNHRLLRAVRRHQILEFYGKWIFWIIIILGGGALYLQYFQPIVSQFITPGSEFQKLLHAYQTGGRP
ncbi:MAG: hypothetical protein KGI78_03965 [Patescibacteria group bacterium]|nr:hypothetical protein [Patescibacteria group bacterium]MDE1944352.1 hypothetical protein [Patescibacteria group bacterium]MDE1945246.1 hypothetical protein [Patescibacteria group bacterium]MDE2057977.1 hypothetical protein [Patescibacteria group bacterium]